MKIILCVVVLVAAAVGTSGKSVSSVPGCEPEVLLDCTKRLEYLNSDTALDLGASQQDLEKVCPTLQEGMQCINDYSNKCLPENIQVYFQSMYNGTISVISELCRPGSFQSEYLKHAPCMDKAKTEYKQCVDQYNGVMGQINPLQKEQRSANIKIMCCSFSQYIECSNMLVLKRCGSDTAKFTQSLLDRLASPIIQEHCYRHFDGEKECEGIMANLEHHGDHSEHEHHEHQDGAAHPEPEHKHGNSPWNGSVGTSEPSSGNDIDRPVFGESADAEAEPSTNAGSRISKFFVSVISPLVVLFFLL